MSLIQEVWVLMRPRLVTHLFTSRGTSAVVEEIKSLLVIRKEEKSMGSWPVLM